MANTGANVTVLLGAQWGDEGKGKVIDFLIANNKVNFLINSLTRMLVFKKTQVIL